jgi:hypothetical protein
MSEEAYKPKNIFLTGGAGKLRENDEIEIPLKVPSLTPFLPPPRVHCLSCGYFVGSKVS